MRHSQSAPTTSRRWRSEKTDALAQEDRRVVRRREREEQAAHGREGNEHDRGDAALCRERRTLVLKREPATHERRDASEAAADTPATARESSKHDRERRDVLVRHHTGVGAERIANGRAEQERRRGATGRRGKSGR